MENDVIKGLYQVVKDRKANPQEGSYTCYLFEQGIDKILKKMRRGMRRDHHCGEEHQQRRFEKRGM